MCGESEEAWLMGRSLALSADSPQVPLVRDEAVTLKWIASHQFRYLGNMKQTRDLQTG